MLLSDIPSWKRSQVRNSSARRIRARNGAVDVPCSKAVSSPNLWCLSTAKGRGWIGIEPAQDAFSSPQTVLKTLGVVLNSEPGPKTFNPTVH